MPLASGGPLHARVADYIRERIVQGEWSTGVRLPSQEGLCEELGVSNITVRRALATLEAEGLLISFQGKGTFVARDKEIVQGPPFLTSFTEDIQQRGWRPGSVVLSLGVERALPALALKLGLGPNSRVVRLERLRTADGTPVAIQQAALPALLFRGLERRIRQESSLYDVLRNEYGVFPADATQLVRASAVNATEAKTLGIPVGSPAFRVERITSDGLGRRIEVVDSIIRGDMYTLSLHLSSSVQR